MERIIESAFDAKGRECRPDRAGNGGFLKVGDDFIPSDGVVVRFVPKKWDSVSQSHYDGHWIIVE